MSGDKIKHFLTFEIEICIYFRIVTHCNINIHRSEMFHIQMQKSRKVTVLVGKTLFICIYIELSVRVLSGHLERKLYIIDEFIKLIHETNIIGKSLGGRGNRRIRSCYTLHKLADAAGCPLNPFIQFLYLSRLCYILRFY